MFFPRLVFSVKERNHMATISRGQFSQI